MLFRRLPQSLSSGTTLTTVEGYVVSVIAHAFLIVSVVVPANREIPLREEVPESFKWAEYLIPKDKPAALRQGTRERITYSQIIAPGGEGTLTSDAKEPERLTIIKPEGVGDDELAEQPEEMPPVDELPGDTILTVLEVDTAAARYDESAAPPYPPSLLEKRIQGSVAVQYVVDTTGRADTLSFVVLSTSHDEFSRAVRRTLPEMRFRSAVMGNRKVRQLVQQLFTFKIDTTQMQPPPASAQTGKRKP